jgi:PUA-domain protein
LAESFKRHFLKDKELKQTIFRIQQKMKINVEELFGAEAHVEVAESKNATIFLINNKPLLVRKDDLIFPVLGFDDVTKLMPWVVVNMGAVPHICNGADVMAPGIVNIKNDFKKDDFIVIVDEQHHKPLAVGVALFDSEAIRNLKHGKTIKTIHFVGDEVWQFLKRVKH